MHPSSSTRLLLRCPTNTLVHACMQWMCYDACPLAACQPHVAPRIARMTPAAKLIFMVREPASGLFSAEIMVGGLVLIHYRMHGMYGRCSDWHDASHYALWSSSSLPACMACVGLRRAGSSSACMRASPR